MSAPRKCTRCGVTVQAIMAGPPADKDTWWRNVVGMRRVEGARWVMRFRMFRRTWLPEDPMDQVRETYTELDLCDDCARAVFAFAQGADR
jgi:hypothetical protein